MLTMVEVEVTADAFRDGEPVCREVLITLRAEGAAVAIPLVGQSGYGYKNRGPAQQSLGEVVFEQEVE
jgi:hypothetical protein